MNIPPGYNTVTPYFFVAGADGFIGFLVDGLGGVEQGRTMRPDGLVANARVRLGTSTVMISNAVKDYGPMAAAYYLYVDDAHAAMDRALAGGAESVMAVADMP